MRKIAVYGSLKKGFYNHGRFDMGDIVDRAQVVGSMFLYHSYPHLYRMGILDDKYERVHDVEIYEVSDEVYERIKWMELGAGYQEYITNLNGHDVTVFYSNDDFYYKDNWIEAYNESTVPIAVV